MALEIVRTDVMLEGHKVRVALPPGKTAADFTLDALRDLARQQLGLTLWQDKEKRDAIVTTAANAYIDAHRKDQDRVGVLGFQPGDIVELKSGSFPMTVTDVVKNDVKGEFLRVFWDRNGVMSGRACSLSTAQLPASAFKVFVPYEQRGGDDIDLPF